MLGEPICVSTLSSHCRGPFRCSSIQQGVLVTVCRLGEEPQKQMSGTQRKVFQLLVSANASEKQTNRRKQPASKRSLYQNDYKRWGLMMSLVSITFQLKTRSLLSLSEKPGTSG